MHRTDPVPEHDRFRRLLLGLPQNTTDYAFLDALVDLAEQLELELDAMFVQETALMDLAGLPGAREFRALGSGWHPIDVSQLTLQLEQAAAAARRLFEDAVRDARIAARFSLSRGTAAKSIGSAGAGDIVAIVQPASAAERVTQQFSRLIDAAIRSHAAVLLVPCRIARSTGPVAAVAARDDDPAIRMALTVAAGTGAGVVVFGPLDETARENVKTRAASLSVKPHFAPLARQGRDPAAIRAALAPWRERMVVMTRGAVGDALASRLAAERSVPVLLIEPER